jgi:hypothetical protein
MKCLSHYISTKQEKVSQKNYRPYSNKYAVIKVELFILGATIKKLYNFFLTNVLSMFVKFTVIFS